MYISFNERSNLDIDLINFVCFFCTNETCYTMFVCVIWELRQSSSLTNFDLLVVVCVGIVKGFLLCIRQCLSESSVKQRTHLLQIRTYATTDLDSARTFTNQLIRSWSPDMTFVQYMTYPVWPFKNAWTYTRAKNTINITQLVWKDSQAVNK